MTLVSIRAGVFCLFTASLLLVLCPAPSGAADPFLLNSRGVELLRQGQLEQAIDVLNQAYRKLPDNRTIRENLATGYLGLGIRQIKDGRSDAAAETLQKGRMYDSDNPRFWFFRGVALFHLGRHQEAEAELNEARAMEENPETLRLLGQVYYESGQLDQAIQVWQDALDRGYGDEKLVELVNRTWEELKVEQTMRNEVGSNFVISYDGRAYPDLGAQVLDVLEAAYNDIGQDLNFYPQVQVPVLLYTQRDFSELTGSPDWSGGLYDGKIRIPVGGIATMNANLRAVLYHEYVHVVVRYLSAGRCPVWLNEGLAEVAGRRYHDPPLNRLSRGFSGNGLLSFERLESTFANLSPEQAELAYEQSYSLARYMIDQYHWYKVAELLRALGDGKPIAAAIDQVFGEFAVDYTGLKAAWRLEAAGR